MGCFVRCFDPDHYRQSTYQICLVLSDPVSPMAAMMHVVADHGPARQQRCFGPPVEFVECRHSEFRFVFRVGLVVGPWRARHRFSEQFGSDGVCADPVEVQCDGELPGERGFT